MVGFRSHVLAASNRQWELPSIQELVQASGGGLRFYLHMESWRLTHSLSSSALELSAGFTCGLCKPTLRPCSSLGHGAGSAVALGQLSHFTYLLSSCFPAFFSLN